jgi:hypothetical protein
MQIIPIDDTFLSITHYESTFEHISLSVQIGSPRLREITQREEHDRNLGLKAEASELPS